MNNDCGWNVLAKVMQLAELQCSAVRARLGQARGGQNHDTGPGDR